MHSKSAALISFLSFLFVLVTPPCIHAQDDVYVFPKNEVDKAAWIANFVSKASKDPTIAVVGTYLVESYKKIPNLEQGMVGTTTYDAMKDWESRTGTSTSDYELVDTLLHSFSSKSLLGGRAVDIYDIFINPDASRSVEQLQVLQKSLLWNMAKPEMLTKLGNEIYDSAKQNSFLKSSLENEIAWRVNAGLDDDARTIGANNSDLKHPVFKDLQPDGSFTAFKNDLLALVGNNHNELMEVIKEDRDLLLKLDAGQQELLAWVRDQERRRKAQEEAEAQAESHQRRIDTATASVNLLATLIGFKNPKLGQDVARAGSAAIQTAVAVSKFAKGVASLDTSNLLKASAGATILTGNLIGTAMQVFSMFSSAGPSPEQQIMEQLQQISMQIEELRKEMHERFDRIDASLNKIFDTMQNRFDRVDWQTGRLNGKVNDIQIELFSLHFDLNKLHQNLYIFFDELSRMELRESINGYLGYRDRTGVDMLYQPDYINTENLFHSWATIHAADQIHAGPRLRDYSATGLFDELNNFPLAFNINFLSEYGSNTFQMLPLSPYRLANPLDLAVSTNAWIRLASENPTYAARINPRRLSEIQEMASNLKDAIGEISNPELFTALLGSYSGKLEKAKETIDTVENSYVSNPDYPKLIDMWAPSDQSINYNPFDNPDRRETLPGNVPSNVLSRYNVDNAFINADYLKLGRVDMVLGNISTKQDRVQLSKNPPPACHGVPTITLFRRFYAVVSVESKVRFNGEPIFARVLDTPEVWLRAETSKCPAVNCGWTCAGPEYDRVVTYSLDPKLMVPAHWDTGINIRNGFATAASELSLTPVELEKRAALLAETTDQVAAKLHELQSGFYQAAVSSFEASTAIQAAAKELSGAKKIVESFIAVGFPSSLEQNDFLRALLYGKERILDAQGVKEIYENQVRALQTGEASSKVDIARVGGERIRALAEVLANIFARIQSEGFSESHPLVEMTLRRIDAHLPASNTDNFVRGDVNQDGRIDITDAVSILRFLFLGDIEIGCATTADIDNDRFVNLTDAVALLEFLFLGGSRSSAPVLECRIV